MLAVCLHIILHRYRAKLLTFFFTLADRRKWWVPCSLALPYDKHEDRQSSLTAAEELWSLGRHSFFEECQPNRFITPSLPSSRYSSTYLRDVNYGSIGIYWLTQLETGAATEGRLVAKLDSTHTARKLCWVPTRADGVVMGNKTNRLGTCPI